MLSIKIYMLSNQLFFNLIYYMRFLVDNKNKIIFGWSAKCGCSHIKYIYYFLKNNKLHNKIHTEKDTNNLPKNITKYTTIIICRNPYKRLVSGFLDKYKINGEFRYQWNHDIITFSMFINELIKNDWHMINEHHFTPQTTEYFDKKILKSKIIKCYDIENIDYTFIENLYNKKIPDEILYKKLGHERNKNYEKCIDKYIYNLYMNEYYDSNIDIKYFYNEELKKLVYEFYKNDFIFFNQKGINYLD